MFSPANHNYFPLQSIKYSRQRRAIALNASRTEQTPAKAWEYPGDIPQISAPVAIATTG